ncbi:MAG: GGDEF domain-containing protein [Clostridia bacterium]|nr:GGDEF domain-containing protein [Clostridia bacterium]
MSQVVVTADLTAALFLLVVLIASYRGTKELVKKTNRYRYCVWICLLGLVTDAASYILDGKIENDFIIGVINYFSFIAIDLLIICYAFYLHQMIKEEDGTFTKKFTFFILAICSADIVFITVGSLTGNLFTVANGSAELKSWSSFTLIIPFIAVISMIVLLFVKGRLLGRKYAMVLSIYLVTPVFIGAIQLINKELTLSYVGSAVAMIIIYVIIQSRVIAETNLRAEIFDTLSKEDMLTGLKNRRGYADVISSIKDCDRIGVVFSDINDLKPINDHYGHDAGDRIIKTVASILVDSFPEGEVCRISGDEFVVIQKDAKDESFENGVRALSKALKENDRIASYGYATGAGSVAHDLVRTAENLMYANKNQYYIDTGKTRRI